MSLNVSSDTPTESKSTTVKKFITNQRRRRTFPITYGLSGQASTSSNIDFDIVSTQAVDLSSHVIFFEVSGFHKGYQCINPKSLIRFLDISIGSRHIETIHDYDRLEKMIHIIKVDPEKDNLQYGGWGFNKKSVSENYNDLLNRVVRYRDAKINGNINVVASQNKYIDGYSNINAAAGSRFSTPVAYLYEELFGGTTSNSTPLTDANSRALSRQALQAAYDQLRMGEVDPLSIVYEPDPVGQPGQFQLRDANAANYDFIGNASKKSWYALKLTSSGFLSLRKHFPLRLAGERLTVRVGISTSINKCLMNIHDWGIPNDNVNDCKLTITAGYMQMDEIEYPESWWDMKRAEMVRNGGLKFVFDSHATQSAKVTGSVNEVYVLTEKRKFLKYLAMHFFNSDNDDLPVVASTTNYLADDGVTPINTHKLCPARPDPLSNYPRGNILEYDVQVNGRSVLDNKVVVYDNDTNKKINEAYFEYAKVSEIVNEGDTKLTIDPANFITDKFLLTAPFSTGFTQSDVEDVTIDAIDNSSLTGQVVIKVRTGGAVPHIKDYFSTISYTVVLNVRGDNVIDIVS